MTLRIKYLLFTSVILTSVIMLLAFLSISATERQFMKDDIEKVSLVTDIIKNGLATMMLEGRGSEFHHFLDTLIAEDIKGVHILGNDSKVISSSTSSEMDKKTIDNIILRFSAKQAVDITPAKKNEMDIYSAVVPIYNERPCQKCHGTRDDIRAILHVEISRTKLVHKVRIYRLQIIALSVLVLIFLIFMFDRLGNKLLLKPINAVKNRIRQSSISSAGWHDISVPEDSGRTDEIHELSLHVEKALSELDRLSEACAEKDNINMELSAKTDEFKKVINENLGAPLSKSIGSLQAFSEELPADDSKREIIGNIIRELNAISKAANRLNLN